MKKCIFHKATVGVALAATLLSSPLSVYAADGLSLTPADYAYSGSYTGTNSTSSSSPVIINLRTQDGEYSVSSSGSGLTNSNTNNLGGDTNKRATVSEIRDVDGESDAVKVPTNITNSVINTGDIDLRTQDTKKEDDLVLVTEEAVITKKPDDVVLETEDEEPVNVVDPILEQKAKDAIAESEEPDNLILIPEQTEITSAEDLLSINDDLNLMLDADGNMTTSNDDLILAAAGVDEIMAAEDTEGNVGEGFIENLKTGFYNLTFFFTHLTKKQSMILIEIGVMIIVLAGLSFVFIKTAKANNLLFFKEKTEQKEDLDPIDDNMLDEAFAV